ncbi:MAG: T9SS type A sorting domain-containing protein, partial [Bacteroidetes bacterium]
TANEGLYHLRAGAGSCMTYSDSMEILTTNTRYLCVYDTFIDLNTKSVLSNLNDTYLFKLAFGTGFGPTQIQKIIIPMVSASTSSSIIELEYINENSGQHFFTNGTLLPNGHLEFILPTSVVAFNRTYTFIIRAQSGSLSLTMGIHGGTPFKTRHAEVQTARYYNITTGARHDLLPQIIFAGTGDISITENHETIGIYPIPADDYVVVENVNHSSEYSLYSIDGRTIQSGTLEENGRFSTSHLAEGLYVLKVENEAGIFSQKVIINHR